MADYSFMTDSDDERAVETILSQAMDHSILEQLAAINCSSFSTTSSDNLPTDLDTRFRKLKSLPTTTPANPFPPPPPRCNSFTPQSRTGKKSGQDSGFFQEPEKKSAGNQERVNGSSDSDDLEGINSELRLKSKHGLESKLDSRNGSSESWSESLSESLNLSGSRQKAKPKHGLESKLKSRNGSPESWSESLNLSPKLKAKHGLESKSKTRHGSSESWTETWSLSESESDSGDVSPVRRGVGCLWCSPKKEKRKQGKENRVSRRGNGDGNEYDYGNDVEFPKMFSTKEQRKIMKKAMKEEEKVNREAEKIVEWAKQASSRMMDVSGVIEDELDDTISR